MTLPTGPRIVAACLCAVTASIQPGRLADLVVLDRDYLTVPADQIKDIGPVMTMVGGRIVYDAAAATSSR